MKKIFPFLLFVFYYTVNINSVSAQGCNLQASISIVTPISCSGKTDGCIAVEVSGGSGTYTYSWSAPGGTTDTLCGVGAGSYSVTVTDGGSCFDSSGITLQDPEAMSVLVFAQGSCGTDCNGSIQAFVNGGIPPYSYSWNSTCTGSLPPGGLCPGCTIWLIVNDAGGCYGISDSVTITQLPPVDITLTIDSNNLNMTIDSGVPPYNIVWSNNANAGPNPQHLTNLPNGTYYVTVSGANGCATVDTVVINFNTSVNELSGSEFKSFIITPNPNDGAFDLLFNSTITNGEIEIYNMIGQKVYSTVLNKSTRKVNISANNLPEGVYFLNLSPNLGGQIKKFIISK